MVDEMKMCQEERMESEGEDKNVKGVERVLVAGNKKKKNLAPI